MADPDRTLLILNEIRGELRRVNIRVEKLEGARWMIRFSVRSDDIVSVFYGAIRRKTAF